MSQLALVSVDSCLQGSHTWPVCLQVHSVQVTKIGEDSDLSMQQGRLPSSFGNAFWRKLLTQLSEVHHRCLLHRKAATWLGIPCCVDEAGGHGVSVLCVGGAICQHDNSDMPRTGFVCDRSSRGARHPSGQGHDRGRRLRQDGVPDRHAQLAGHVGENVMSLFCIWSPEACGRLLGAIYTMLGQLLLPL